MASSDAVQILEKRVEALAEAVHTDREWRIETAEDLSSIKTMLSSLAGTVQELAAKVHAPNKVQWFAVVGAVVAVLSITAAGVNVFVSQQFNHLSALAEQEKIHSAEMREFMYAHEEEQREGVMREIDRRFNGHTQTTNAMGHKMADYDSTLRAYEAKMAAIEVQMENVAINTQWFEERQREQAQVLVDLLRMVSAEQVKSLATGNYSKETRALLDKAFLDRASPAAPTVGPLERQGENLAPSQP